MFNTVTVSLLNTATVSQENACLILSQSVQYCYSTDGQSGECTQGPVEDDVAVSVALRPQKP